MGGSPSRCPSHDYLGQDCSSDVNCGICTQSNNTICASVFDYCKNVTHCDEFDFPNQYANCREANSGSAWLKFTLSFVFLLVVCYGGFISPPHFDGADARPWTYFFCVLCFGATIVVALSIWCVSDDQNEAAKSAWTWSFVTLIAGPMSLVAMVMVSIMLWILAKRIVSFSLKPVHKWCLVSLVLLDWLFFGLLFVLGSVELIAGQRWINIVQIGTLILLGLSLMECAWEVQTGESMEILKRLRAIFAMRREQEAHSPLNNVANNQQEDLQSVQLLLGQLVIFMIYVGTFIGLAVDYGSNDPCFMNIATLGPFVMLAFIWHRQTDVKNCCQAILGILVLSMIVGTVISCVCDGQCRQGMDVMVTMIGSLWTAFVFSYNKCT